MATSVDRNKPLNRPKKSEAQQRRRRKVHVKRLLALGVDAGEIKHLNSQKVRAMLRRPKKTAKLAAKKKA